MRLLKSFCALLCKVLVFLSLALSCYSQNLSVNQNYILECTVKVPGKTSVDQLNGLPVNQVNRSIQYFDGLGRPLQSIQWQGSPTKKDLVQVVEYDAFGREVKKYLPYADQNGTDASHKTLGLADQGTFYNFPTPGVKQIASPYSQTVFEASPLNRVMEQGSPGADWQPVIGSNAGHTIKMDYGTNALNEVKLWTINPGGNGAIASVYLPAKLYKTISKDENWRESDGKAGTSEEFKDSEGQVILKRVWETDTKSLSTYYVYDDYGNLRYVLPPAVNENGQNPITSFDETQPVFDQFIYGYHYDGRKRLIEKKIPGKGWEYLVYNKLDQVVLTQDANQRAYNQWLFTKYDALGRVVVTGRYDNPGDRLTQQAAADAQTNLWESRISTGEGYDNVTFPQAISYYHSINYYDDYDFPANSFGVPVGSNQVSGGRTRGLLTGSRITTLGTGNMLLTVNYYDQEGRVVQSKSQNHLSGIDVVDNTYNFANELTASTRTHTANDKTTVIASRYEYDHMGRKTATFENINSQGEVQLSNFEYNEIGQLLSKKLHNQLQNTIFTYNDRGWLKSSSSNEFNIQLKYNDGTTPQFNGNISGQDYTNGSSNAFTYQYDKLNRLTNAVAPNLGESISYDVMGNITSLTRDGFGTNNYTVYTGNKLMSIAGFTNSNYIYDVNGNLINDSQKNISLGYNHLNLPIVVSGSQNVAYSYNAAGGKLKKVGPGGTIDYASGIQYANGVIELIQTEEGIARNNNGIYSYEYNLTDHLGNVRATFYQNPSTAQLEVLQRDDYYAFGLRKSTQFGNNKYLYNGKELQEELGQYDYGARFYDPVIGRWNVIDPFSEKMRRFSTYNYAFGNPIRFVDPDGMMPDDIIYKNRVTGKEVGREIMPGDNVVRYTDAKNTAELVANNFDRPIVSQGKASTKQEIVSRAYAYQRAQNAEAVDYQDISRPSTALAITRNVAEGAAAEYAAYKIGVGIESLFAGSRAPVKGALDGSFSVLDWSSYPAGAIKPSGPIRILEGSEYASARSLANSANASLRAANPEMLKGFQIHEIHPVKFGGSPTELSNKILLTPSEHAKVTNFWNSLMRNVNK